MQHNSQAAATFALQALCAGHPLNTAAAMRELALLTWLGASIEVDLSPAGLDTMAADLSGPQPAEDEEDGGGANGGFGRPPSWPFRN